NRLSGRGAHRGRAGTAGIVGEWSPPLTNTPSGTSLTSREVTAVSSAPRIRARHSSTLTDSRGSKRILQYGWSCGLSPGDTTSRGPGGRLATAVRIECGAGGHLNSRERGRDSRWGGRGTSGGWRSGPGAGAAEEVA